MDSDTTPVVDVYLEVGKKKTFASAIEWPGWSRSGQDELSSLAALADYGRRYARVIKGTGLTFQVPHSPNAFSVVERLTGGPVTDFGAPELPFSGDSMPVSEDDLHRFEILLKACWQSFDQAVEAAQGKELSKGPRGGGRDLEKILRHVLEADRSYLGIIGGNYMLAEAEHPKQSLLGLRKAILDTLPMKARGELPETGPRGGARWSLRYYVRRSAWHVLDHTWEIENRAG